MKTIQLTTSDTTTSYHLKSSWQEVSVDEFVEHQTTIAKLKPARALVARAAWLSDVPLDVLKSDVSIAAAIVGASTWLTELPAAARAVENFTHNSTLYQHVGNLDTISAAQLEALLDYLQQADDEPLTALPQLLAVLYTPAATEQTPATVEAAAAAFRTLPITLAWPALAFFLSNSAPSALRIQQFSHAKQQTLNAVRQMQTLVTSEIAGDSGAFWRRLQWKGIAVWTRCVEKLLSTY